MYFREECARYTEDQARTAKELSAKLRAITTGHCNDLAEGWFYVSFSSGDYEAVQELVEASKQLISLYNEAMLGGIGVVIVPKSVGAYHKFGKVWISASPMNVVARTKVRPPLKVYYAPGAKNTVFLYESEMAVLGHVYVLLNERENGQLEVLSWVSVDVESVNSKLMIGERSMSRSDLTIMFLQNGIHWYGALDIVNKM